MLNKLKSPRTCLAPCDIPNFQFVTLLLLGGSLFFFITIVSNSTQSFSSDKQILESVFLNRNRPIEEYCAGDSCFFVFDRVCQFENGSFFVVRMTSPDRDSKYGFTGIAILKTPKPLTRQNRDTRKWEINRDVISADTVVGSELKQSILSGLFPTVQQKSKVMIVGVATGILQTFLAKQYPNMYIEGIDIDSNSLIVAKKWYGFQESNRNRIIIDDARNQFKKKQSLGLQFDAIMVDACYNNFNFEDEWMCPVKAFREPETISNMNRTLSPNGVVTMNVFHKSGDSSLNRKILNLYKTVFKQCTLSSGENDQIRNQILTCSNGHSKYQDIEALNSDHSSVLAKYSDYIISWQTPGKLTDEEFFEKLWDGKRYKTQAKICSDPKDETRCTYIVDIITRLENGSRIAARALTPHKDIGFSWDGFIFLQIPDYKTHEALDSSKWRPMTEFLGADSMNLHFVVSAYGTGLIEFSKESTINVLNLGIATGSLQTFIQSRYPSMNVTGVDIDVLTEKVTSEWFGMSLGENNHIVIQDAVSFVEKSIENGVTYDLIVTDVCMNVYDYGTWICPIPSMQEEHFLRNLRKIMKDDGVITINTLYLGDARDKYNEFLQKLLRYFEFCDDKRIYGNMQITCYMKQSSKRPTEEDKQVFLESIGIENFLYDYSTSIRGDMAAEKYIQN